MSSRASILLVNSVLGVQQLHDKQLLRLNNLEAGEEARREPPALRQQTCLVRGYVRGFPVGAVDVVGPDRDFVRAPQHRGELRVEEDAHSLAVRQGREHAVCMHAGVPAPLHANISNQVQAVDAAVAAIYQRQILDWLRDVQVHIVRVGDD
ncbi:hypothetical protein OJ252_3503 [Cryptosporidium canis]|uniref:Uncharacterized protein n=1 Tax=Cryptosporidium canis TaxID=195482 RepID=A0ABQ8P254_9CRYT|nr:hypothetical protein OJ252_3503 [Cryptosporidium canis]